MAISTASVLPTSDPLSQPLSGVSQTALLPLYLRAQETLRGDRILKALSAVAMIRALKRQIPNLTIWMSQSFLDTTWLDQIQDAPDQPILILMENVSLFLKESDIQFLLTKLRQRFQSAEILMDVVCMENLWHRKSCQILADPPRDVTWSLRDSHTMERWDIGIQILEEYYYLSYIKHFASRIHAWDKPWVMPSIPMIKNANRLLRIGLQGRCPP